MSENSLLLVEILKVIGKLITCDYDIMRPSKKELTCDEMNELIGLSEAYPALWELYFNEYKKKDTINEILKKY